jgi:hypothetical protein
MQVEVGQLRVWGDAISLDKTPFLVLDQIDTGWGCTDWLVIWRGLTKSWSQARIEAFSEVVSEG